MTRVSSRSSDMDPRLRDDANKVKSRRRIMLCLVSCMMAFQEGRGGDENDDSVRDDGDAGNNNVQSERVMRPLRLKAKRGVQRVGKTMMMMMMMGAGTDHGREKRLRQQRLSYHPIAPRPTRGSERAGPSI